MELGAFHSKNEYAILITDVFLSAKLYQLKKYFVVSHIAAFWAHFSLINDIVSTYEHAKFIYADDASVFMSSGSYADLITTGKEFLHKFACWSAEFFFNVNSNKTKPVIFLTKGTSLLSNHTLTFKYKDIEVVDTVKVLEVNLQSLCTGINMYTPCTKT